MPLAHVFRYQAIRAKYKSAKRNTAPPHVYALVDQAYNDMNRNSASQALGRVVVWCGVVVVARAEDRMGGVYAGGRHACHLVSLTGLRMSGAALQSM